LKAVVLIQRTEKDIKENLKAHFTTVRRIGRKKGINFLISVLRLSMGLFLCWKCTFFPERKKREKK